MRNKLGRCIKPFRPLGFHLVHYRRSFTYSKEPRALSKMSHLIPVHPHDPANMLFPSLISSIGFLLFVLFYFSHFIVRLSNLNLIKTFNYKKK